MIICVLLNRGSLCTVYVSSVFLGGNSDKKLITNFDLSSNIAALIHRLLENMS